MYARKNFEKWGICKKKVTKKNFGNWSKKVELTVKIGKR